MTHEDTPPIAEFVPGYEVTGWLGYGAPKGTPADVIDKLNKGVNAMLADPAIKARMLELGSDPLPLSRALGRGGSSSLMTRSISCHAASLNRCFSSGVVPVSSSYRITPKA